jgi:hypothetical protein
MNGLLLRVHHSRFELWCIEEDDSQAHIRAGDRHVTGLIINLRGTLHVAIGNIQTAHSRLGLCDDAVLPCSCRSNGVITRMQKLQAEKER